MTERDEYTPEGWTPEAWQKLMDTDVKIAYRLVELGLVLDPNDKPYDPVEVARIDAEYDAWLAAHDEAVRQEERERIAREIEKGYLGPDFARRPDGTEGPEAYAAHAYDEGLEHAARVARAQGREQS